MRNLKQYEDGRAGYVDHEGIHRGPDGVRVAFTVGAEGAGVADGIDIVCQLTDGNGVPAPVPMCMFAYFSTSADGLTPAALLAFTEQGNGFRFAAAAGISGWWVFGLNGDLVARLVAAAGAFTGYLVFVHPEGHLLISPLLTWA